MSIKFFCCFSESVSHSPASGARACCCCGVIAVQANALAMLGKQRSKVAESLAAEIISRVRLGLFDIRIQRQFIGQDGDINLAGVVLMIIDVLKIGETANQACYK